MAMVSAINIQLIPQYPVIQSSVTFRVTGIKDNILTFLWFKGPDTSYKYQILTYLPNDDPPITKGLKYFSRAHAFANGSLSITNLNVNDSGFYTVKMQTQKAAQASVFLQVNELVSKPIITATHSHIQELDAFNLTCSAANADKILWKKDDASLQDDIRLSADNTTITFFKVNRTDAGAYQCEAHNLASRSTSDVFILNISYDTECSTCNTNMAIISGVACAVALIIAVLIGICFLLYKKCAHPVHEYTGSPYEQEDPCAIYDNVLELMPAQTSREEHAYMVLQYVPESPYNELNR
ncbi:cell adhesion molecule CEACAM19 isoform X2 [Pyxicephalus adspersus]